MERRIYSILRAVAAGLVLGRVLPVLAAESVEPSVRQSISLTKGWNTVYLGVTPGVDADTFFAAWPVRSVSLYRADAMVDPSQIVSGNTGEATARQPFLLWSREAPLVSTLKAPLADSVLVCYATNAFSVTVTGRPAAPRLAWHRTVDAADTFNYVGVLLDSAEVPVKTYLAGAPTGSTVEYFRLGGSETAAIPVKPFTTTLTSGQALLVKGDAVSDWSGPLYVSPAQGVDFGTNGTVSSVTIRNDATAARTVSFQYVSSATVMAMPDLLWKDGGKALSGVWSNLDTVVSKTLDTGEVWTVRLGLDRAKLRGSGDTLGGILKITEDGAAHPLIRIPVTANDLASPATAWPSGLWSGEARLSQVSRYLNDTARMDGLAAGGVMKIRLLVHMDADGNARLLQRVTMAGDTDANGNLVNKMLFAGGTTLPSGKSLASRMSSAALPVDVPVVMGTGRLFGGETVLFAYRIAATSPSNPFRHPLHPQFDGLKADFKTPAPDGDNFTNYVGNVKPELFGIGGEIRLKLDAGSGTVWDPEETVTGTCRWTYTGVRREGPIHADGTFTLQRIVKEADLKVQE